MLDSQLSGYPAVFKYVANCETRKTTFRRVARLPVYTIENDILLECLSKEDTLSYCGRQNGKMLVFERNTGDVPTEG